MVHSALQKLEKYGLYKMHKKRMPSKNVDIRQWISPKSYPHGKHCKHRKKAVIHEVIHFIHKKVHKCLGITGVK